MGDSWDHQEDGVSIVTVAVEHRDYKVVESALFDRRWSDGKTPVVSRATHRLRRVRRVQNRKGLDLRRKRGFWNSGAARKRRS